MVAPSLAIAVTGIATALLAIAIAMAGGWRKTPQGADPVLELPREEVPDRAPAPLRALAWRLRVAAETYRAVLLVVLGLTPLGAGFVHLIAPAGAYSPTVAAILVIMLGVWGPPRLLSIWWLGRLRRACPALVRPRRPGRARPVRLLWLALAAWSPALILVDVTDSSYDYVGFTMVLVLAFTAGFVARQARTVRGLDSLPRSVRLDNALESLPGPEGRMTVTAVLGWRTQFANASAISSLGRQGLVFAPPVAAALSDSQLRAVVAHELAHLRSHDTWWRLLRMYLSLLASAAMALALHAIPVLRRMAGLHTGAVTAQALPFLLATAYLTVKVLRMAELRARRAEESAADRQAVAMTADVQACLEAMAKVGLIVGTPGSWTLPQRLLIASHPAMGERLRLINADAAPGDGRPLAGRYRTAFAYVAVVAFVVGGVTLAHPRGTPAPPEHLGWYRIVPPSRFDGGVFAGASGAESSVWSAGIKRFNGAVPVNVFYNKEGQPWLYMWGAQGDLTDPAGELSAFWRATDEFSKLGLLPLPVDTEPTGPLTGYLQCNSAELTCAWADYSGIIVVSQLPPSQAGSIVPMTTYPGGIYSEQALTNLTQSFRGAAELLRHHKIRSVASLPVAARLASSTLSRSDSSSRWAQVRADSRASSRPSSSSTVRSVSAWPSAVSRT
jgi:Zn-dependent protease with chaperone function